MTFGSHEDLVLLALLVALAALLVLALKTRIPYPILLVLGGLTLGFVPGIPQLALPPDLVLVAILPPLLYSAAYFTSLRDLRQNVVQISALAIGLVAATTAGVAAAAHYLIPGVGWGAAFVLGAIVSPTDPLAATTIAQRLGVRRRVVAIAEGESLINDGSALVLYRVGVVAVVAGTYSVWEAGLRFVWSTAGGVAVGLGVGYLIAELRRRLDDPPVEVTIALLSGYFAYLPAAAIGVSGVISVVTVGVYMGWRTPELTTYQTRLDGAAMWQIFTFVVNALLFALVGLQLHHIVNTLSRSAGELLRDAVIVCATVILTRIVWIFPLSYGAWVWWARRPGRDEAPPWQGPAVLSWMGLRGAVTLAAALALPLTTDAGDAFPNRDLIIFLAFAVIVATLVLQGLTLPAVIRLLGVEDDGLLDAKEEAKARIHAANAATARLEELVDEDWVRPETLERMRGLMDFRRNRFSARFSPDDDGEIEERSQAYQRLMHEVLDAERSAVLQLRREGRINDDVMRRVTRDLDLEEARLDS